MSTGETTNRKLKYPKSTDNYQVAADMQTLAEELDSGTAGVTPKRVTTLPVSPYDGQEIDYQSTKMGEEGVVWRFRYREASTSAYKWELVGGPPLQANTAELIEVTLTSKEFAQELTNSPKLEVPLEGSYIMTFGAEYVQQSLTGGNQINIFIAREAAVTQTSGINAFYSDIQFTLVPCSYTSAPTVLAAGWKLRLGVNGNTTSAKAFKVAVPMIGLLPVKV